MGGTRGRSEWGESEGECSVSGLAGNEWGTSVGDQPPWKDGGQRTGPCRRKHSGGEEAKGNWVVISIRRGPRRRKERGKE